MATPNLQNQPAPETLGYQALGALMGSHPDAAILRRFRNVGSLDLLYRQADLQHSIAQWTELSSKDKADAQRRDFDLCFHLLQEAATLKDPSELEQWEAWCDVSQKLDQYYDRLLKFQKICSLAPADKHQTRELRQFLREQRKINARFFAGSEIKIYDERYESDMISIAYADEPDYFTRLSRGSAALWFHRLMGWDESGQVLEVPSLNNRDNLKFHFKKYTDETTQKFSKTLYALITSALVIFAVTTLNRWKGPWLTSLLIFGHNSLFTLAMAYLTRVRPVELFGAAAAYAAVLVVFASNWSGPGSPTTT